MQKIGITERGDPSLDKSWISWVSSGNPAILITKNPSMITSMLRDISSPNVIVHATITGYGGTILEPNVPELETSLAGYKTLLETLGDDRVVLRIDPIILTEKGLHAAQNVLFKALLINPTPRVRISFLDMYDHVKIRFENVGLPLPYDTFHAPSEARWNAWKILGEPELCGEPDMPNTPCISVIDCEILGVDPVPNDFPQRTACGCLGNKHELLKTRKRCFNGCIYCYWK